MKDKYTRQLDGQLKDIFHLESRGNVNAAVNAINAYVTSNADDVDGHLMQSYIMSRTFHHSAALTAFANAVAAAGGPKALKKALDVEIVLIFSNCHGKILRSSLINVPEIAERFLFLGLFNISPKAFDQSIADIADMVIFQSMSWNDGTQTVFYDRFRSDVNFITFPAATMLFFWPYYLQAPAKTDENGRPVYRYAYGDRFIDSRVRQKKTAEKIVREYTHIDLPITVNLEKVMEVERHKEFGKEANTDVKIRQFIEDNYKYTPVFYTPNHPTREVMNIQAVQLAQLLGVSVDLAQLPIDEYPETSSVHHPIHPSIVQYLGLTYRTPNDTFYLSRAGNITFEQFIPLYIEGKV
ncbi:MAG: WcbI family polysaccharide biosynthesis putative acetyltransferase [Asticcacaulis sp.]